MGNDRVATMIENVANSCGGQFGERQPTPDGQGQVNNWDSANISVGSRSCERIARREFGRRMVNDNASTAVRAVAVRTCEQHVSDAGNATGQRKVKAFATGRARCEDILRHETLGRTTEVPNDYLS